MKNNPLSHSVIMSSFPVMEDEDHSKCKMELKNEKHKHNKEIALL